jgi:hypothetical protein
MFYTSPTRKKTEHWIMRNPITHLLVTALLLITYNVCAAEPDTGAELYMRDGQLKSHPVRIFVTHDISDAMKPRLTLMTNHAITEAEPNANQEIEPKHIGRWQSMEVNKDEPLNGTLLLFDLKDYPVPPYKGMTRVLPVLTWEEEKNGKIVTRKLIGTSEVNIGSIIPAAIWTLAFIALLTTLIITIATRSGRHPIGILRGPSGRLSLAHTQVALWTISIGMMITGYGFLRFDVPDIPESLAVLMGLSIATGGISQWRSHTTFKALTSKHYQPRLYNLISEVDKNGKEVLSLPRAQMVFWTGITLTLFIIKSTLDGVLWQVPWEMVAFMGMSQAGYLGPKWLPKTNGDNSNQ